ncbi:MAG: hypothetical protein KAG19_00355 [Methylococcales bacterium]|nr:hypothetical protein [Methylococcales bacterium]
MTSIPAQPQTVSIPLNKNNLSKRTGAENKQPQVNDSKDSQTFQEILDQPTSTSDEKPDSGKNKSNSGGGDSQDGQPVDNSSDLQTTTTSTTAPVEESDVYDPPKTTIEGTEKTDFLFGTSRPDVIDAKGGDDLVFGQRGDDYINGGDGSDLLFGGKGNDTLNGGNDRDFIFGGKGKDHLNGGQGNDFLFGGKGNDHLHGGDGNDWVFGGKGDDQLNGGRGNDFLFGGKGDDTFSDEDGSNYIDGGRGDDTLNLARDIGSYHIELNDNGDFLISEQSKRLGAPRHTVKNIESFQFNDITISADELRERINNPVKELSLSEAQKTAAKQVFNVNNASIDDNNHDGKVSEGDTLTGSIFSESDPFKTASLTLSKDNAAHINGELGQNLELSPERLSQVSHVVNPSFQPEGGDIGTPYHVQGVLDTDNSGGLSVGDVVYSRPEHIGFEPIANAPRYHRLTEVDIQKLNNEPLQLTALQEGGIKARFDIGEASPFRVLDRNGDDTLGAGDVLEITVGGDALSTVTLTEEDAAAINSHSRDLSSQATVAKSLFDLNNISLSDRDENGKVSEGDILEGTFIDETGAESQASYTLDKNSAAHIRGELGEKLEFGRLNALYDAITFNVGAPQTPETPLGVLDSDNSGGLSEGDMVYSRSNRADGGDGKPSYHRVTADDIQRLTKAPLEVSNNQYNAINERFDIGTGSYFQLFDKDASHTLSAGDELRITVGGDAIQNVTLSEADVEAINGYTTSVSSQKETAESLFQINNLALIDRDSNRQVSAGDTLNGTFIDETGATRDASYTLNQNSAAHIRGELGRDIEVEKLHGLYDAITYNRGAPQFPMTPLGVLDTDNSGGLSVGDILYARANREDGGDGDLSYHRVTAGDLQRLNEVPPTPNNTLTLTDQQHLEIGARFNQKPAPYVADGITIEYTGVAIDKDGDNQLSVGDIVKLHHTGGFAGVDTIVDHILTEDDLSAIQTDRSNPLLDISNGLSSEQKQGLYTALYGDLAFTSAPSIQSVFDHNSDGRLSVGDVLTIHQFDETTGATSINFHKLTQAELDILTGAGQETPLSLLQENQQKWDDSGIEDKGYSFRLERSAFAVPASIRPTISEVSENGQVSDRFADGDKEQVPENYNQADASIRSLFQVIQDAIDSGADKVDVTYDPVSGYPVSIYIDYNEQIADEELSLTTSQLLTWEYDPIKGQESTH